MNLENKKILVTGADGFIGSHLVERLVKEKCDLRAFVYYNSFNSWGWLDTIPEEELSKIEVFPGDIRDVNAVRNALKDVDIVCHLAALIGIPYSYVAPESYVDTNVKGTLNMLQASKELETEKVIITSTSETYGSALYVPIDEKHPYQPQSPYSASKIAADMISMSFFYSFGLPVSIIRPFNTFGPRQSARAIIPSIIIQILKQKSQIELGNLTPTRDFTYVLDTCEAFVKMCKTDGIEGEVINIASSSEISIKDLVNQIKELMSANISIKSITERIRPEKSEVSRLFADISKASRLLKWRPNYSFVDGLKLTIDWFSKEENLRKYKLIYNI